MIETDPNRRGYLDSFRLWTRRPIAAGPRARLYAAAAIRMVVRVLLVPVALVTGALMVLGLRLYLSRSRPSVTSPVHDEASTLVAELVEQYPLHLYPVVAKALELAYLQRRLGPGGAHPSVGSVVEVAIGEGTFSARVFGDWGRVTALDLNPHSLAFAARRGHVRQAVVCDGIQPPIRPAAFDTLVSVNFLHHVTDKKSTVANWSHIARSLVFNENTPYWASGWTVPYLLKRLGLGARAERAAQGIESRSLQHLVPRATLERDLRTVCRVEGETSFLSERAFFYCGLFSFLMRSFGPPTPAVLKGLYLGPLHGVVVPLTRALARLLVEFDRHQDRATDTFVFFSCAGDRAPGIAGDGVLLCPTCRADLVGARCDGCGVSYPTADGMLFLLAPQWRYLFDDYVNAPVAPVPAEHL